jgi:hypothetical protein
MAQGKDLPQETKKKDEQVVEEPADEPKRNAIQEALDKTAQMEAVEKTMQEAKK